MQRSHQAEVRAKLEQDQQKTWSEAHWVIDDEFLVQTNNSNGGGRGKSGNNVVFEIESSFMAISDVSVVGRKSFKSFNKEIEALAKDQTYQQQLSKSQAVDKRETISESEMARLYQEIKADVDNSTSGSGSSGKAGKKRGRSGGSGEVVGDDAEGESNKNKEEVSDANSDREEVDGGGQGTSQRFKFLKPSLN
ncbi:M-phase phosphoprotein 6 [Physocladia obscura]|uniref:M-phase phosphoprotein 6 n=1 Tax=Physocladia obscura TaxID=109957 RepID=A0AAD5SPN9_9FUNG|nr:M-phase phosphoprotein 6 [Physocladia obscura]